MISETSAQPSGFSLPTAEEPSAGGFIDKQLSRAHILHDMVYHLGAINTSKVLYNRIIGLQSQYDLITVNEPQIRFPLHLAINPTDLHGYTEVFKDNAYSLPERLEDSVNGRQIVDLGGFTGMAAAFLASRHPDSPVLSVEPHHRNYTLLQTNAKPYGGQITPHFAAVSPVHGTALASHPSGQTHDYMGTNFSVEAEDGFSNPVSLDTLPSTIVPEDILAEMEGDTIGILKVDIEGAERALFLSKGIHELLSRTAVLMIETHDRLMPGCEQAVHTAVAQHPFHEQSFSSHTATFIQSQLIH